MRWRSLRLAPDGIGPTQASTDNDQVLTQAADRLKDTGQRLGWSGDADSHR